MSQNRRRLGGGISIPIFPSTQNNNTDESLDNLTPLAIAMPANNQNFTNNQNNNYSIVGRNEVIAIPINSQDIQRQEQEIQRRRQQIMAEIQRLRNNITEIQSEISRQEHKYRHAHTMEARTKAHTKITELNETLRRLNGQIMDLEAQIEVPQAAVTLVQNQRNNPNRSEL